MPTKKTEERRGIRTTEFWLSAVTALLGLLIGAGIVNPEGAGALNQTVGIAGAALTSLGYSVSRGMAKQKPE